MRKLIKCKEFLKQGVVYKHFIVLFVLRIQKIEYKERKAFASML